MIKSELTAYAVLAIFDMIADGIISTDNKEQTYLSVDEYITKAMKDFRPDEAIESADILVKNR